MNYVFMLNQRDHRFKFDFAGLKAQMLMSPLMKCI